MSLLDRISARTVDRPAERRFAVDQWLSDYLLPANEFSYNGSVYPFGLSTTYGADRAKEISTTLPGYMAALRSCPPAFGAQLVRASVLSQARFCFRNADWSPKAGRTFTTSALGPLQKPWTNATTGQLVNVMEWHEGLAGNAYVTNRTPGRLRVLRPDWVVIAYGSHQQPEDAAHALDGELIGYLYCNGGIAQGRYPVETLLPDEVAHWSPLPDPECAGIGMSWITPAIREIQGDRAATEHKLKFFINGATPNMVVKGITAATKEQFEEIVDALESRHAGVRNAYRTLYLAAGADATVVGANLRQIDFKATQGAGETRISMLSRVHPVILGASEGLQGSSLNAGNFGAARRAWADTWIYPTLQDLAAALSPMVRVPADAELWTKTGDMPILREDAKDAAEIEQIKAATMSSLITQGFTRKSVIAAVTAQDMTLLEEDPQWISVQLQQAAGRPALPAGGAGPKVPPAARSADDDDELDDETWALLVALDELSSEVRAWDPAKHARIPKGQPGAGQFLGMVEHIKGAIAEHLASGGKGDPFEHFSREQLRRAAKARGHTLPKGISREDIAKLLLDDLGKAHGGHGKSAKTKVAAGPRDAIDHVPDDVKKLVFSSYKAQPHGQLLTSSTDLSYENLLALAHVYGKKVDGGLSVLQAARIVDEQLTKNQGLPNKGFLEKKLKDWLATPEGAGYVKYNTKPTQSIVDSITGEVTHSPGIKLKPGQKVPKLSGPGAYRKTLLPGAFTKHTDAQMNALQDAYLKEHGITWTPDQIAAITNYSGGGYAGMNGYLRDKSDAGPLVKKQVADLQAAMVPVREHTLVLRGTGWDQFPEGFQDPDGIEKLLGKTIVDQGFVSTSVAGAGGHFSHQPVSLEIEVPKGTPAVFLKKYSYHGDENELLLAAGTKFRVISVSHAHGKTHVRLRVVTPK